MVYRLISQHLRPVCERAEEPASCVAIMLSMEYRAVPTISFRTRLSGTSGDSKDSLCDIIILLRISKIKGCF